MDEKTAWQNFLATGSVTDYLTYIQFKDASAFATQMGGKEGENNAHFYNGVGHQN